MFFIRSFEQRLHTGREIVTEWSSASARAGIRSVALDAREAEIIAFARALVVFKGECQSLDQKSQERAD